MILVTHAYSRHNAGDGLLVDLTLQRLLAAGVPTSEVVVLAMDPASFPELDAVIKFGSAGRSADVETLKAVGTGAAALLGALAPRVSIGAAARAMRDADGFVSVGGGYLRAGTRTNQIGTLINHLPQLEAAARSRRPSVYLPQSVGPLSGPVGSAVSRALHRVTAVHLRDDRSVSELGAGPGIHRTPDLAVLELAERMAQAQPQPLTGSPIIVARALTAAPTYHDRLRALAAALGDVRWGVQAEGSATKSDRHFYTETLGVEPAGRVKELLHGADPGPVVSVRLHGALESLIAGVPAVHLGYERKSWGAYEDLGLSEWVHSARGFDPELVRAQVEELARDPSRFWEAARSRVDGLREVSDRLTSSIGDVLGR